MVRTLEHMMVRKLGHKQEHMRVLERSTGFDQRHVCNSTEVPFGNVFQYGILGSSYICMYSNTEVLDGSMFLDSTEEHSDNVFDNSIAAHSGNIFDKNIVAHSRNVSCSNILGNNGNIGTGNHHMLAQ